MLTISFQKEIFLLIFLFLCSVSTQPRVVLTTMFMILNLKADFKSFYVKIIDVRRNFIILSMKGQFMPRLYSALTYRASRLASSASCLRYTNEDRKTLNSYSTSSGIVTRKSEMKSGGVMTTAMNTSAK